MAIIPFIASLLHTGMFLLAKEYQYTKREIVRRYDACFRRPDILIRLAEYAVGPFMAAMVVSSVLGDIGVIHSFGWINGDLMTKERNLNMGAPTSILSMYLYTSRAGLGIVAFLLIYIGVTMYSGLLWIIILILLPLWGSRVYARLTQRPVE